MFRGWRLVAALFLILTVSTGVAYYGLPLFLRALVAEGRFDIKLVSFASSFFAVSSGLAGLFVGRLVGRHDIRLVMTVGCVVMASAFALLPWISGAIGLCFFYILLGSGYGATSQIPSTTLVTRWFVERRSAAMSIAMMGNSFGAILLAPPVAYLIQHLTLGGAAPWLALILLVGVLPLTWWVLHSWPQDVGLVPLGQKDVAISHAPVSDDTEYRAATRSRYFVGMSVAFMFAMAAQLGGLTHVYNMLVVKGQTAAFASAAIATMASASIVGRVPAVWALRSISTRSLAAILLALQGLALWGCGLATHPIGLIACIIVLGSTVGNLVTTQSLLIAEAFGVGPYARLYALISVWSVPGLLVGPTAMGLIYDASGGYRAAYLTIGAVSLAGLLAIWGAGRPPNGPKR